MFHTLAAPAPPSTTSVAQVRALFTRLFLLQALPRWRNRRGRGYQRLWTPLITLWYLLWQRLQPDATLAAVVLDARLGGADAFCPPNAPLSQRLRSHATTAFCHARRRQPVAWVYQAFTHFTNLLRRDAPNLRWREQEVVILDGSTVRLRPHGNLPQCFAPASNQHGQAYWCLMRVVVGFCATSGLAVVAGVAPERVSEQTLAVRLLLRDTARRLWVGDRNFGVWRVARAAAQTQAHLLARLTDVRARALAGRALAPGEDLAVTWRPSAGTQCDPGLTPAPVAGRLLCLRVARPGFRVQTLYLFTTRTDAVAYPPLALLELYGLRWHAELNLRYLKTQLHLNQLEVQSGRLAVQQWYAGLLTYNLLRGVMLWAGTLAGVPPLELSFAQTRRQLAAALTRWQRSATPQGSAAQWEELLREVARERQPRRRQPRPSEPRAKRHVWERYPPLRGSRAAARQRWVAAALAEANLKS